MLPWTGSFANSGSPTLKFSLYGAYPKLATEFEGIIDTGFTGFISMPLVQAFPLGVILFGTTSLTLADGSSQFRLTGWGNAQIDVQTKGGVIILEPNSNEILLGMEFVRAFNRALLVFPKTKTVVLIDEDEAVSAIADAAKSQAEPKETQPEEVPVPAQPAAPANSD
jgi:predicted aspartyl protease